MSKHALPETTDSRHYTYESHIACSMAFERFSVRLAEMGFTEPANMAKYEAKASWEMAEAVRDDSQETQRINPDAIGAETEAM